MQHPQGKNRKQGSLAPLWITFALLLVGGGVLAATMMVNARKARARAQFLRQQIQVATALGDQLNQVTDAIIGMRAEANAVRSRAEARVSGMLEVTSDLGEVSAEYAARPGLKSDPERLQTKEMEIRQQLQYVGTAIDEAKVAQTAVKRELSRLKREPNTHRCAATIADFKSRLLQLEERRDRTAKLVDLAEVIAKEIDTLADNMIETERSRREEEARIEQERKEEADAALEAHHKTETLELIKVFRFEEAQNKLMAPGITYHTDGGRERHQVVIDQCEALVAMKSALIKSMIATPFSWGWRQDGSPRDIIGATAKYVLVGERDIPWESVSLRQMSTILNEYIYGRKVSPGVRCDHSIAAAIYFAAQGRAVIAEAILDAAVDMRPTMTRDADRLARPFMERMQESAPPAAIGIDL